MNGRIMDCEKVALFILMLVVLVLIGVVKAPEKALVKRLKTIRFA